MHNLPDHLPLEEKEADGQTKIRFWVIGAKLVNRLILEKIILIRGNNPRFSKHSSHNSTKLTFRGIDPVIVKFCQKNCP